MTPALAVDSPLRTKCSRAGPLAKALAAGDLEEAPDAFRQAFKV
jgi:hypothetical protein